LRYDNPYMRNRCEVSSALENVRRMVATCRENCRQITENALARPIRSVGIVGAGIMGTAIAVEHALHAVPVVLMDKSPEALRHAATVAAGELAAVERSGERLPLRQTIAYTLNDADLGGCDLVLESIVEKRPAKQAVYAQIRPHLADRAILATNTSTIPIARLSAGLADPARFCGLHFCHPVRLRPLVEVISGPATSPETLAAVLAHAISLGKLPLVVADGPGFIVNRLLLAYLDEALAMVTDGVPIPKIDAAMVEFGMPLGPLELLDEIGLDTAFQSGVVLAEIFGERSRGSELLVRMVKAQQYGMKAGAGFYTYPEKIPNPTCGEIAMALRPSGRSDGEGRADPVVIAERLLRPMSAEAARMLAEKKVASAWQIDLAVIFGLGFPFWRGGLLWWSNQ
jgi:3-hydroxyacyl-CoA dehydrogenase